MTRYSLFAEIDGAEVFLQTSPDMDSLKKAPKARILRWLGEMGIELDHSKKVKLNLLHNGYPYLTADLLPSRITWQNVQVGVV